MNGMRDLDRNWMEIYGVLIVDHLFVNKKVTLYQTNLVIECDNGNVNHWNNSLCFWTLIDEFIGWAIVRIYCTVYDDCVNAHINSGMDNKHDAMCQMKYILKWRSLHKWYGLINIANSMDWSYTNVDCSIKNMPCLESAQSLNKWISFSFPCSFNYLCYTICVLFQYVWFGYVYGVYMHTKKYKLKLSLQTTRCTKEQLVTYNLLFKL